MKIPLGDQGQLVARPTQGVSAPEGAFGGAQARALGGLGEAVAQTGASIGAQIRQQQEETDRLTAATTLANLGNSLADIHTQTAQGIEDGSIPANEGLMKFNEQANQAFADMTSGMDERQRSVLNAQFVQNSGRLRQSLGGTILKRKQSETKAGLLKNGEALDRLAMRDLPGAMAQSDQVWDSIGPAAGYDPAQIAALKQQRKETMAFNFGSNLLQGAAKNGNLEGVNQAEAWLNSDAAAGMDPAKRSHLQTMAIGYRNGILAANERQQAKLDREKEAREQFAVDSYNKAFDLSDKGHYFSTETIAQTTEAVQGTAMQEPWRQLLQSQQQTAGWATLPLVEQRAQLERMRSAAANPKIGVSTVEDSVYNQRAKITASLQNETKENPWQAAQGAGYIQDAPEISIGNINDAQAVITKRMQQIGSLEKWTGFRVSPLQPNEAESLSKVLRALPPDQAASALSGFGDSIGNAERLAAFGDQLAKKDRPLTLAMMYGSSKTSNGRLTSELVLRGSQAIKDGTAKIDTAKETGWKAEIAKQIRGATPSEVVAQDWIDSAYFIQAAKYAENGSVDIPNAINLATGGIIKNRDGTKIPLPYGMKENQFEDRIGALKPVDFQAQALDGNVYSGSTAIPMDQFIDQLPKSSLVHAGQGRYNIRAGNGFITNAKGSRIVIDLNPAKKPATPPVGEQGKPMQADNFVAVPNPAGLTEKGNLDLTKRPRVKNSDGSVSTVRSMSVTFDDGTYLLPTVIGNKVVSEEEAIRHFKKTGEHLGKFKTDAQADAYAEQLHLEQEKMYAPNKGAK